MSFSNRQTTRKQASLISLIIRKEIICILSQHTLPKIYVIKKIITLKIVFEIKYSDNQYFK